MGPRTLTANPGTPDNPIMRRRLAFRGQRGQTSIEYMGALVLVGVTITAILIMKPGMATMIADGIRTVICRITGGECAAGTTTANPFLPTTPCVRSSAAKKVGLSVTVFSVTAGGEIMGRKEVRTDGVAVTLQATGQLGAEIGLGAEAKARIGEALFGEGSSVEASLTGELSGARTWLFPDEATADQFIDDMQSWALENATALGIRTAGGPVGGWVGEQIYRNVFADHDDFDFPDAYETLFKGGVKLEGSAGATHPTAYANIEGALGAALGGKVNHRTGDVTLFYEINLEAEGSAGLNVVAGGGAGGEGTALVALTLDKDGNPKTLTLTGRGTGSLQFENVANWKSLDDVTDGLRNITISATEKDTHTWEFQGQLQLANDPEARAAAMAWLAAHVGGTNPLVNPEFARASVELARQLNQKGALSVKEYEGTNTGFGGEFEAARGIKFGAGGEYEDSDSRLVDARYREPGVGFIDIPGCSP
jgi:hypothetical protein